MSDRHAYFFGLDPKNPTHPSHEKTIEARVKGNYLVRCGHCGVSLMGRLGYEGPVTEITWTHDGSSWFGTFCVPDNGKKIAILTYGQYAGHEVEIVEPLESRVEMIIGGYRAERTTYRIQMPNGEIRSCLPEFLWFPNPLPDH